MKNYEVDVLEITEKEIIKNVEHIGLLNEKQPTEIIQYIRDSISESDIIAIYAHGEMINNQLCIKISPKEIQLSPKIISQIKFTKTPVILAMVCKAGYTLSISEIKNLKTLATAFLNTNISAYIAPQFKVSVKTAELFTKKFLTLDLLQGAVPMGKKLCKTRKILFTKEPLALTTALYGDPQLYL